MCWHNNNSDDNNNNDNNNNNNNLNMNTNTGKRKKRNLRSNENRKTAGLNGKVNFPSVSSMLYVRIFLYKRRFGSFFYIHVTRKKAAITTFV